MVLFFSLWSFTLRNIFFTQPRIGQNEKGFLFIKLKTMHQTYNAKGILLPDNQRVTPLGRFLRKISLDELPQLWHVIKGEMNLIGPRPLLPEYLPLYSERQRKRHTLKPGITGWAQIKGRNALPWKDRLELDIWYIENRSWWLDLKIIALTILKFFYKNDGDLSSEKFKGNG
jgi:lipopolysaccharide/colanic/teichoic acid biosynthesis glycosyltransferase